MVRDRLEVLSVLIWVAPIHEEAALVSWGEAEKKTARAKARAVFGTRAGGYRL